MKRLFFGIGLLLIMSCKKSMPEAFTAQQIVNKSIAASGGENFKKNKVSFTFRGRAYESYYDGNKKVLKRITPTDSVTIIDMKTDGDFKRFFNDSLISLPDTLASKYANSVNSVHYFARLPFGLNDRAVKKELLGESTIKNEEFYKVKVTFAQQNGGKDFEDIYLYWFDKKEFKPKYLAYRFFTDEGGIRFREAYNERYIEGIRFVDYNNLKPKKGHQVDFMKIDSLFEINQLQLLSKIELTDIKVETNR